jgi:hypothetical protein
LLEQWEHHKAAARVIDVLNQLPADPNVLELMATVHYFALSDERANVRSRPESLVADVSEYEGQRFGRAIIQQSLDQLRELELVRA